MTSNRRLIAVLSLASLCWCSSWAQSLPDMVPVPRDMLESWQMRLKALEISLTQTSENLAGSEANTLELQADILTLTDDIRNWETKYQDLLTDSRELGTDLAAWQAKFADLERQFLEILEKYAAFQTKLERISIQLRRAKTAAWTLGIIVVVETVLLLRPWKWGR